MVGLFLTVADVDEGEERLGAAKAPSKPCEDRLRIGALNDPGAEQGLCQALEAEDNLDEDVDVGKAIGLL